MTTARLVLPGDMVASLPAGDYTLVLSVRSWLNSTGALLRKGRGLEAPGAGRGLGCMCLPPAAAGAAAVQLPNCSTVSSPAPAATTTHEFKKLASELPQVGAEVEPGPAESLACPAPFAPLPHRPTALQRHPLTLHLQVAIVGGAQQTFSVAAGIRISTAIELSTVCPGGWQLCWCMCGIVGLLFASARSAARHAAPEAVLRSHLRPRRQARDLPLDGDLGQAARRQLCRLQVPAGR